MSLIRASLVPTAATLYKYILVHAILAPTSNFWYELTYK